MKKILIFILISLLVNKIYAQTITSSGTYTVTLATTNIREAGNNYPSGNLVSNTNQTLLTVNSPANSIVSVFVQKSDTSWDSRLTISALRTGTGTGSGGFSTTGGTALLPITNVPQYFFEVRPGSGTRVSNIPIQYYTTGFTVLLPVKAYTTTLLYTVTNQ